MKRGYNKDFQVQMIKTLCLHNYRFDVSNFDIFSEVDTSLSPSENWSIFKEKYNVRSW